jgi:hypothetical protein
MESFSVETTAHELNPLTLASRMNLDRDVLFLALSSHGSEIESPN